MPVLLLIHFAIAIDGELQVLGERIDDRYADAVQAAGNLIGAVVELTARMQDGHDDLRGGSAFLGVDVRRNSTAVIGDRYGLVGVDGDDNPVAMTGQRFVDRVVDDLENHVVQTGPVIGVTDVHSGAFSDCVEPF